MSYVAQIRGELVYDNFSDYELALKETPDNWVDQFTLEPDCPVRYIEHRIIIPNDSYRNLGRNTGTLLEPATSGYIAGVTNDTSWHGFIDRPSGSSSEVDLENWVEDMDTPELQAKPNRGSFGSEDAYQRSCAKWQQVVGDAFLTHQQENYKDGSEMGPPPSE